MSVSNHLRLILSCSPSFWWLVDFMVLNATFNNISVILWRSVLLDEENGVPGKTTDKLLTIFITDVVSSTSRITLVVIGNDCKGSCKSNYHNR